MKRRRIGASRHRALMFGSPNRVVTMVIMLAEEAHGFKAGERLFITGTEAHELIDSGTVRTV